MPANQNITVLHKATSALRGLPDFLIIGAQKCGTSSLYRYLVQHPDVAPAVRKEIHYFDWHYGRGPGWYRSHFPLRLSLARRRAIGGRAMLTGEASPYYLFHPHVPRRAKALLPDVKLLVLLRDPVERTVSAHQHQVRRGRESASLEEAISREHAQLPAELRRLADDDSCNSDFHRHFAYLARGLYASQLTPWFEVYGRNRIMVISSEEFFRSTPTVFAEVLRFLDLRVWQPAEYRRFNAAEYDPIDPTTHQRLVEYFRPHNEHLYRMLDRDFGWPR